MTTALHEPTTLDLPKSSFSKRFSAKTAIILIVIAAVVIGIVQANHANKESWRTQALSGSVAMTESQLRNLIKSENLTVYWTGPMTKSLYMLNTKKSGQSILTYLPQKSKSQPVVVNSRVIGTYYSQKAFTESLNIAASDANVSFKNADGNLVFYPKDRKTGVFVAIPNSSYQIEIYDPIPGQAINVASLRNQLTQIGL